MTFSLRLCLSDGLLHQVFYGLGVLVDPMIGKNDLSLCDLGRDLADRHNMT